MTLKLKHMKQAGRLGALNRLAVAVPVLTLCALFSAGSASAQDGAMSWQLLQPSPNQAQLDFGVPETDNIGARAVCGGPLEAGTATLTVGLDFGDKPNGAPISVRFSGGGSEQSYKATVVRPASGEGLFGGAVPLYLNDPLWAKMTSLESIGAAVPGFTASRFELRSGQSTIQQFLTTCRRLADPTQTADNGDATDTGTSNAGSGVNQQEAQTAFKFAQELDSVAAYTAFLKNYPTGFYADLARAYLEKAQAGNQGDDQAGDPNTTPDNGTGTADGSDGATPTEPLTPLALPMPNTRWVNFSHEQDEGNARSYAAGVTGNGVQLIAWCGDDKLMNFELTQNGPDTYPQFDARTRQGLNGQTQPILFSNGQNFLKTFSIMEMNGDVVMEPSEAAGSAFVTALIRENTVTIGNGVFTAPFRLQGSKQAMCNVLSACGASNAACARPVVAPPAPPPPPPRDTEKSGSSGPATVCRARSVLIEGQCILRRYADEYRRKLARERGQGGVERPRRPRGNGCRNGRIRVEGECIRPSEARAFCGPGFRLRGDRCVSRGQGANRVMLRTNNGGRISLADCRRQGMTEEFGYCVEDD